MKLLGKFLLISAIYYLSICSIYQFIMWDEFSWNMGDWSPFARMGFICGWLLISTIVMSYFICLESYANKSGRKC